MFLALSFLTTALIAWRSSFRSHERELTELRVKVDTMWSFLTKRGVVEGVNAGLLSVNSPVRLTPESATIMQSMEPELREFRQQECPDCDEKTLMLAIERKFGTRLVQDVCIPNNIAFGVCLIIATAIAKGGHTLTEILDEQKIQPSAV